MPHLGIIFSNSRVAASHSTSSTQQHLVSFTFHHLLPHFKKSGYVELHHLVSTPYTITSHCPWPSALMQKHQLLRLGRNGASPQPTFLYSKEDISTCCLCHWPPLLSLPLYWNPLMERSKLQSRGPQQEEIKSLLSAKEEKKVLWAYI